MVESPDVGIAGYVTLAAASVLVSDLGLDARSAAGLPRYPLPALLIARLAVDERCLRRGLGRGLLVFALDEALVARDRIGCVGALVDAKPTATGFYEQFGFLEVVPADADARVRRMFLGIATIAEALRST